MDQFIIVLHRPIFGLLIIALFTVVLPAGARSGETPEGAASPADPVSNIKTAGTQMPFIANQGQTEDEVGFYAPTFSGTVFVTRRGGITYALPNKTEERDVKGWSLKEEFVNGRATRVAGV